MGCLIHKSQRVSQAWLCHKTTSSRHVYAMQGKEAEKETHKSFPQIDKTAEKMGAGV